MGLIIKRFQKEVYTDEYNTDFNAK